MYFYFLTANNLDDKHKTLVGCYDTLEEAMSAWISRETFFNHQPEVHQIKQQHAMRFLLNVRSGMETSMPRPRPKRPKVLTQSRPQIRYAISA